MLNDAANGENEGKWHQISLQGLQLCLSKLVGVSRIGTSLIPGEFIKFNGCKCLGCIIDIVHRFDNIPTAEQPSERDNGSFLCVQKY